MCTKGTQQLPKDIKRPMDHTQNLKIGVAQKSRDKITFIHRTFSEYLVYLYILKNLDEEKVLKFAVENVFYAEGHTGVKALIDYHLRTKQFSEQTLTTIGLFMIENWQFRRSDTKIGSPLHLAAAEKRVQLFEMLFSSLQKVISESSKSTFNEMCSAKNRKGLNLLMLTAGNISLKVLQFVLNYMETQLKAKDLEMLFQDKSDEGCNVFYFSINSLEIFKHLMRFSKEKFGVHTTKWMVVDSNYKRNNLLHEVLKHGQMSIFNLLLE
jgi:hypothetical protein